MTLSNSCTCTVGNRRRPARNRTENIDLTKRFNETKTCGEQIRSFAVIFSRKLVDCGALDRLGCVLSPSGPTKGRPYMATGRPGDHGGIRENLYARTTGFSGVSGGDCWAGGLGEDGAGGPAEPKT